jgi:hypothetical protein
MKQIIFSELKSHYEMNMREYVSVMNAFPWEDRGAYSAWLAQTFHYVSFSSRIISMAAAFTPLDEPQLHSRFVNHSAEESNHEILAKRDLEALGGKIEDYPLFSSTRALYQSQYYYAQVEGAASLMGYFISLEGLALHCAKTASERVLKATQNPKTINFLRVHAEDDIEHVDKALKALEKFKPESLRAVAVNLENTRMFYSRMLQECQGLSSKVKAAA